MAVCDSQVDIDDCKQTHLKEPLCKHYAGYAYAWYDMANDASNPYLRNIEFTRNIINSLGSGNNDPQPDIYRTPDFRQKLHRLANVMFSSRRKDWKSKEEASDHAYQLFMRGHEF